ncbi:MAG TPA: hypothetical protein VEX37_04000, partial [Thermomicrobiales bacterium]|nr:hypothetical protein [Thermomicrobiales bacterium]
ALWDELAAASRRASVASVLSALAFGLLLFHYLVVMNVQTFDDRVVAQREYGSATRALERIERDNFTTIARLDALAVDPGQSEVEQLVFQHAPLLVHSGPHWPARDDTWLGVYFRVSQSESSGRTATTIRYYLFLTDENGGMPLNERMARYGHPFDGELIYKVLLFEDQIVAAYQAPVHQILRFAYDGETRPIFAIASPNHNFRLVLPDELTRRNEATVIAPLPLDEFAFRPMQDPDFVALSSQEVFRQHGLDIGQYVYVTFDNPPDRGAVNIGVRVGGRWYYVRDVVPEGVVRAGDRRVAIRVPATPFPGDIQAVRLLGYRGAINDVRIMSIYLFPPALLLI